MSTMSTSSERITAAELERSKRARTIARNWLEAEETRMKLAGLDPSVEGDGMPSAQMRPSKFGRPSALERVKEARISGMEVAHFEKGLTGSEGGVQQKPVGNASSLKLDLLKAVIASGRSPEEAGKLMESLSPYLLAVDDPAAALLVSRIGGSDKMGVKEILEIIQLVKNTQGSQSASDPAAMANAITNAIRTGAELGKNTGGDAGSIQSLYQQMSQQQQQSFDRHLELLRERYADQPSFDEQLTHVVALQKQLGGLGKESDTITSKRLELEHQRWTKEQEISADVRKSKSQNEMVKQITGSLAKVIESPTVRELGKSVGRKIPGIGPAVDTFSQARTAGAQAEINDPTQTPYAFTCPKCKTNHTFSAKDLTLIGERGGRWVCTGTINGEPCAEPFQLKGPSGSGGTSSA
jgi:hypothetical protein